MNEAPKKIWYDFNFQYLATSGEHGDVTQYIRADLVNGLVEALGDLVKGGESMGWESVIKVITALKALEEENGN
jgi:hypothetical protein